MQTRAETISPKRSAPLISGRSRRSSAIRMANMRTPRSTATMSMPLILEPGSSRTHTGTIGPHTEDVKPRALPRRAARRRSGQRGGGRRERRLGQRQDLGREHPVKQRRAPRRPAARASAPAAAWAAARAPAWHADVPRLAHGDRRRVAGGGARGGAGAVAGDVPDADARGRPRGRAGAGPRGLAPGHARRPRAAAQPVGRGDSEGTGAGGARVAAGGFQQLERRRQAVRAGDLRRRLEPLARRG